MKYQYIIVGQGIAGTLIAMECIARDLSFVVIDDLRKSSSSRISAGIINPITGRKFLESWMYEDLEKALLRKYKNFEDLLGIKYLFKRDLFRSIHTVADLNNWDASALAEESRKYMESNADIADYKSFVHSKLAYGKVNAYQLQVAKLLNDFRAFLKENKHIIEEPFEHAQLSNREEDVVYKNISAERVVFCEGYQVINNPLFGELPFRLAKGELLLVKIPNLRTSDILKDQLFLCPLDDDLYWIGATYAWDNLNDLPTDEKRTWLIHTLEKMIDTPYEIIDHKAGVRPATNHRKPMMGTHPDYKNIHLFNGLGTKGSSLGPYWAEKMMDFLEMQIPLNPDVDLRSYYPS